MELVRLFLCLYFSFSTSFSGVPFANARNSLQAKQFRKHRSLLLLVFIRTFGKTQFQSPFAQQLFLLLTRLLSPPCALFNQRACHSVALRNAPELSKWHLRKKFSTALSQTSHLSPPIPTLLFLMCLSHSFLEQHEMKQETDCF